MTRPLRRFIVCAALSGLLCASAGCSSPAPWRGEERAVLAVQTDITDGYTRNTDEIADIGLPPLHNLTGHAVRLLSVQWVGQPPSARIISIYGSAYAALGHGFIGAEGNLPIACPGWHQPVPVNLYTSYKVVNPPLPGPVPIHRSGICG